MLSALALPPLRHRCLPPPLPPFDWMEIISLQGKTNFSEKCVGEYSKFGVGVDTAHQTSTLDTSFRPPYPTFILHHPLCLCYTQYSFPSWSWNTSCLPHPHTFCFCGFTEINAYRRDGCSLKLKSNEFFWREGLTPLPAQMQ